MKKRIIKLLLAGIVICTSISTIGCQSSDFEEPVEEEVTEEQQVNSEVKRKEQKKKSEQKNQNEQKENKKSTKQSEKEPAKAKQEQLIAWAKSNVNSKVVVEITDDSIYPDCSGKAYVDGVYVGMVYYWDKTGLYELEEPHVPYGPNGDTPDMPTLDDYIEDYNSDEDEYNSEYNEYCMNCGKLFVGSQSGYCSDCARKILGDNYDFLQ